jgi:hypothetical protein
MSFETKACVVIVCDGCDDPWGEDSEGIPHFDSESEAVKYVRGCDWIVIGAKALCGRCAARETCAKTGHKWMDWRDLELEGVHWRSRYCEHCDGSESDPSHEALLALLDAAKVLNALAPGGGSDA